MLFNDTFILELLLLLATTCYISSSNLMMLLYTSGLYLIFIGIFSLLNDADIYIGFLWVIDLGVGLVFFIFILHFTSFLFQKSQFNLTARHFIFSYLTLFTILLFTYYLSSGADASYYGDLKKTWFFKLSYIDYFLVFNTVEVTDLNTLRDSYFLLNSFEFFIVNFSLFFGLIASILMTFIVQRIFAFLNFSQILNMQLLKKADTGLFLRSQDFTRQQNTTAAVRSWIKSKK